MSIRNERSLSYVLLVVVICFIPITSSQTTTPIDLTNLTSPTRSACLPVFHSRYGMWVDPCHHVVHIPRGWHGTLECTGPASGLSIVGARYGPLCQNVSIQNTCADTCKATNAARRARDICGTGQKQRCRIKARDDLFGNPCSDQAEVLVVSFTCDYYIWTDEPIVGLDGQIHDSSSGGAKWGTSADFRMTDDVNILVHSTGCRQPRNPANGFSAVGCQCTGFNEGDTTNDLGPNLRMDLARTLPTNSTARYSFGRQSEVPGLPGKKTFLGICYSNDNPNIRVDKPSVKCARLARPLSATSCFLGETCCQPV